MPHRKPRWELVRTGPRQYHVRFRSSNGNVIVSSESYPRKRDALRAIEVVCGSEIESGSGSAAWPSNVWRTSIYQCHYGYVEVRMVTA
jgi:uncharacterized protein YegP (UPF0339 family)